MNRRIKKIIGHGRHDGRSQVKGGKKKKKEEEEEEGRLIGKASRKNNKVDYTYSTN